MRDLVILRGSPGSGKSTWIKENHLEPYTISPDNIRTMVCAPILEEGNTHFVISQENENYVWSLLFEVLEKRMEHGDFTVIDATHSRQSDFTRYNQLCDTYRYRKYVVSFTDIPLEECKRRNKSREEYKWVPDEVIDKMYARFQTQNKTSGWVEIPRDKFWDTFKNQIFDFNEYNKIHIFGDIHGCYQPLMEYILKVSNLETKVEKCSPQELKNYMNDDEFYLFTGDYIDRGLQNKEVVEFLYEIHKNKNVLLLQGNHESYLYYYAIEMDDKIVNREFIKNTIPQIKNIPSDHLRSIYRKLGQMAYFNYKDKIYFVTHAGLNCIPEYLHLVSTDQFIHGVGKFLSPIDEEFTFNSPNTIQVHGHRSRTYEEETNTSLSISLEDRIEFGGNLVVLELDKNKEDTIYKIKNNIFKEPTIIKALEPEKVELSLDNLVENLRGNANIKETTLSNNISSFNFTREAFEKGKWDKETVKARGLFIDTKNNKIVARGYEKFFNINEQEKTKLFNLKFLFDTNDELVAYRKYNGFLGILSYYHDSLQFHSKSSNCGEYANYFKNLFYKQLDEVQVSMIEHYLKSHDVSLTFEVIDLENDPHIIDEKRSRVVLLDIIHNTLDFEKESYSVMVNFAKSINLKEDEYKQIYTTFKSYRELTEFYDNHKDEQNFEDTDIEGVVIEGDNFMTKLKFNYYTFWKFMRNVSEMTFNGRPIKYSKLYNKTSNLFYKFIKDKYEEEHELLLKIRDDLNLGDRYNLSKIKNGEIEDNKLTLEVLDNTIKSKIILKFKALFNKNKNYKRYIEKSFIIDKDIINKLKEIQDSKRDIISLRNEFYAIQQEK